MVQKPPQTITGSFQGLPSVASRGQLQTRGCPLPSNLGSRDLIPSYSPWDTQKPHWTPFGNANSSWSISQKDSMHPAPSNPSFTCGSLKPVVIPQRRHVTLSNATFPINICWHNSSSPTPNFHNYHMDVILRNSAQRLFKEEWLIQIITKNCLERCHKIHSIIKNNNKKTERCLQMHWFIHLYIKNIYIYYTHTSWVSINELNRQGSFLYKIISLGRQTRKQWTYNCEMQ